jgi:hypothetical protein
MHWRTYDRLRRVHDQAFARSLMGGGREQSEIRLVGMRERRDVVTEEEFVIRFTNVFDQWTSVYAPPMLGRRPRHVEGARVVNGDGHLQRLAAFDHLETLDNVNLLGVGRAVIVNECPVIQSDRTEASGKVAMIAGFESLPSFARATAAARRSR